MPAQAAKYRTAGTMGLCSVAFLAFTFIVRVVQGLQAGLTWWVTTHCRAVLSKWLQSKGYLEL